MVADDKYRVLWVEIEIISTPDTYRLHNVKWLLFIKLTNTLQIREAVQQLSNLC